jgi:hypothetical protein
MTLAGSTLGTGYGIQQSTSGCGAYVWSLHAFNPTSNKALGANTWDYWAYHPTPDVATDFGIYISSSSFDLTDRSPGSEVVACTYAIGLWPDGGGYWPIGNAEVGIKDPDGVVIGSFNFSLNGSYSWIIGWIGSGLKAGDHQEIWKDGTYTFYVNLTYTDYLRWPGPDYVSKTFTVSNCPTIYTGSASDRGKIWVEGDYLCFIGYQGPWKIICRHDNTSSAVGATPGQIWLETDGRISYIDSSGNKRSTKMGDQYGYGGWSTEIPSSPGASHAGKIWVSSDNNDTYLMIIGSDGVKYRIGAGYQSEGAGADYQ